MTWEAQYLNLLDEVLTYGEDRSDRTGVGTRAIFGQSLDIDLTQGFPLVTTKRMPFKSILSELLWFIEGSSDERRLAEILHGTRDLTKKTIWSPNAEYTAGSKFVPTYKGDLGRVYGVQWRTWLHTQLKEYEDHLHHHDGSDATTYYKAKVVQQPIDQLAQVVDKLKNNPTDRRIIMTAWNPGELDQMALPPCHMFVQFFVTNNGGLEAQMYQRSVDTFLGLPFNIASYSLLVHILAKVAGLKPKRLRLALGDTHIYSNHIEQVKQQLDRVEYPSPQLKITSEDRGIDDFKMTDFELIGYISHEPIKGEMAQ